LQQDGLTEASLDAATRAAYIQKALIVRGGDSLANFYTHEVKAAKQIDYSSNAAYYMSNIILANWKVGDIIQIPGLVPGGDVKTQVQAMLAAQDAAQIATERQRYLNEVGQILTSAGTQPSFVDPTQPAIEYAAPTTVVAKPFHYEYGYRIIHTYKTLTENDDWGKNLPNESTWYSTNSGKLEGLTSTAPEKIYVDGILSDTGWAADGWIVADTDINASGTGNEAGKFTFKYQIRNDGKYLYVAAVYDSVAYTAENSPVFWLWVNDNANSDQNWTKFYKIGYNNGGKNYAYDAVIPELPDYFSDAADVKYTNLLEKANGRKDVINYTNELDVIINNNPNQSLNDNDNTSAKYDDSAFYGYTDIIEESVGERYYPNVNIQRREYIFGKECAKMTSGGGTFVNGLGTLNDDTTVVEFRIAIDEADANGDGFEYFVSAARNSNSQVFTSYYPAIFSEPDSDFCYHNYNYPFWKWYSDTSLKMTEDDYVGDMYLCNAYAPVVTLGAKFNDNYTYTNSKGEVITGANALRFGGLYTENMIRYNDGTEGVSYWDVSEMGIVIAPTALLGEGNNALTIDTAGAKKTSAVGIVDWVQNTNYADYESFAFYVTIAGIPDGYESVKYSARTYICYRNKVVNSETGKVHGTDIPDYYGNTIVRSADIIKAHADSMMP